MKNRKVILITVIVVTMISYFVFIQNKNKTQKKETTITECVALSKDVRINENTKKCFDNLSTDEFLQLLDPENKAAIDLYNQVEAVYDTRTEAQKDADTKAVKEFFDKAP